MSFVCAIERLNWDLSILYVVDFILNSFQRFLTNCFSVYLLKVCFMIAELISETWEWEKPRSYFMLYLLLMNHYFVAKWFV